MNGKTLTGVNVKSIKNIYYIALKDTSTIFGVGSSLHKESNSIIVGTGIDQAKKLNRGSATRLIINGKTISGVKVPTIGNSSYVPIVKVAPALGAKASVQEKTKTITITYKSAGTVGVESLKLALSKYVKGVSLSGASIKTLNQYQKEFFAANRSPLSLDEIAKVVSEANLAKSVAKYHGSVINLTFVEIDTVHEVKLSNGQTLTHAIGHTGGKYRELTETWEDSTYFEILFLGSNEIVKGDKATVNGVPVGSTTVDLVSATGVEFKAPMYIVAAGNFLSSTDEYDIRKEQSESNPGKIIFPDEPTNEQKALERLSVRLEGGKLQINDDWQSELEIKSLKIMDYEYKLSSPIRIPNNYEGGLSVSFDQFLNSEGASFVPQDNEAYFIQIVTNAGEITRFESHDPNG